MVCRNHADLRPELLRLGRGLTALQRTVLATARLISDTGIPITADSMIGATPPAPPPLSDTLKELVGLWLPQQECRQRRAPLFRQAGSCPRWPDRDQGRVDRHDLWARPRNRLRVKGPGSDKAQANGRLALPEGWPNQKEHLTVAPDQHDVGREHIERTGGFRRHHLPIRKGTEGQAVQQRCERRTRGPAPCPFGDPDQPSLSYPTDCLIANAHPS